MTDDLKEALNDFADWHDMDGEDVSAKLLRDAVARIEQLEAALREIAQHDMQAIALDALRPGERAALAGEKKDE